MQESQDGFCDFIDVILGSDKREPVGRYQRFGEKYNTISIFSRESGD